MEVGRSWPGRGLEQAWRWAGTGLEVAWRSPGGRLEVAWRSPGGGQELAWTWAGTGLEVGWSRLKCAGGGLEWAGLVGAWPASRSPLGLDDKVCERCVALR